MDFSDISEGQVFKNYKEFCKELNIVPKSGGNSRTTQINEIRRYCDYENEGHKIIIREIYDEPIEKMETRGRKSIYTEVFTLAIAECLRRRDSSFFYITKNKLLTEIKAINTNYDFGMQYIEAVANLVETDKWTVREFYGNSGSTFNYIVSTCLDKLKADTYLRYNTVTMVGLKSGGHREATIEDNAIIMETEHAVLEEMELQEVPSIPGSPLTSRFRGKVKWKLAENEECEFTHYYRAYAIFIHKNKIEELFTKRLKVTIDYYNENKDQISEVNRVTCERLLKGFQSRKEKEITNPTYKYHRTKDNYINSGQKLIDMFILENAEIDKIRGSIIAENKIIQEEKNPKWGFNTWNEKDK